MHLDLLLTLVFFFGVQLHITIRVVVLFLRNNDRAVSGKVFAQRILALLPIYKPDASTRAGDAVWLKQRIMRLDQAASANLVKMLNDLEELELYIRCADGKVSLIPVKSPLLAL